MKLGRKNLVYSISLAGILLIFLLGYFIYMLPSLYVDYMMEQNLKSVKEQHNAYMKNGTYEGVKVKSVTACFSVKIPDKGDSIFITGKAFSVKFTAKDEELRSVLKRVKEQLKSYKESDGNINKSQSDELRKTMEELSETIKGSVGDENLLPFDIDFIYIQDMEKEFKNETVKVHSYSDNMVIAEAGIEDSGNKYINYIAMEQTGDGVVFSVLPVITPEMNEIRSVVLESVPMLGAVMLLVVLLFSQIYSRGIVTPIVELVGHAEQMKIKEDFTVQPIAEKWNKREDEVGELADTLDEFYLKIKESYEKLEEENKRQEVFLRASTHQLKTPIAATLLLLDGMINEVGKYKETKIYLPKVKEQLLSMRKMVEDILYLNNCDAHMKLQNLEVGHLLRERLKYYQIQVADKQLVVEVEGEEELNACIDELMTFQIIDNLISNIVKYTPSGKNVQIKITAHEIRMENFGVTIQDELLPHIFEPFVSGNHGEGGHGLGLYIVSYYARKQNISITIHNNQNSVVTILAFPQ